MAEVALPEKMHLARHQDKTGLSSGTLGSLRQNTQLLLRQKFQPRNSMRDILL